VHACRSPQPTSSQPTLNSASPVSERLASCNSSLARCPYVCPELDMMPRCSKRMRAKQPHRARPTAADAGATMAGNGVRTQRDQSACSVCDVVRNSRQRIDLYGGRRCIDLYGGRRCTARQAAAVPPPGAATAAFRLLGLRGPVHAGSARPRTLQARLAQYIARLSPFNENWAPNAVLAHSHSV
jgi:hypothetical protein